MNKARTTMFEILPNSDCLINSFVTHRGSFDANIIIAEMSAGAERARADRTQPLDTTTMTEEEEKLLRLVERVTELSRTTTDPEVKRELAGELVRICEELRNIRDSN